VDLTSDGTLQHDPLDWLLGYELNNDLVLVLKEMGVGYWGWSSMATLEQDWIELSDSWKLSGLIRRQDHTYCSKVR
jgi:hypothetical protein